MDFASFDIFMVTTNSTIKFQFGDRKAPGLVDSNCSRHMTRCYDLVEIKTCNVQVNGAFLQGSQGTATHSGLLQLGQLCFKNTVFVPDL